MLRCVQPWRLRCDDDDLWPFFALTYIVDVKQLSAHIQAWIAGPTTAWLPVGPGPLALSPQLLSEYLVPHCGPELLVVWLDDWLCRFNCDR